MPDNLHNNPIRDFVSVANGKEQHPSPNDNDTGTEKTYMGEVFGSPLKRRTQNVEPCLRDTVRQGRSEDRS